MCRNHNFKIITVLIAVVLGLFLYQRMTAASYTYAHIVHEESSEEIQYEYDESGRVVKAEYPDGTLVLYEYDKNGNVVQTRVLPPDDETMTSASTIQEDIASITTEYDSDRKTTAEIRMTSDLITTEEFDDPIKEDETSRPSTENEDILTDSSEDMHMDSSSLCDIYHSSEEMDTEVTDHDLRDNQSDQKAPVDIDNSNQVQASTGNGVLIMIGATGIALAMSAVVILLYKRRKEKGEGTDEE